MPRWSPSGKSLYFLSTRSGSSQVWRLPMESAPAAPAAPAGDPMQVTDLPLDVANLTVSPDGSLLAFSLEVFIDCPDIACTKERLDATAKRQATGLLYDGDVGMFRHWDTWADDALIVDKASGRFADASKVHRLDYKGQSFKSRGPFTVPRSAQGHPLIIQAGQSGRGKRFAAEWGEMIFTYTPSVDVGKKEYADLKAQCAATGRDCRVARSASRRLFRHHRRHLRRTRGPQCARARPQAPRLHLISRADGACAPRLVGAGGQPEFPSATRGNVRRPRPLLDLPGAGHGGAGVLSGAGQ